MYTRIHINTEVPYSSVNKYTCVLGVVATRDSGREEMILPNLSKVRGNSSRGSCFSMQFLDAKCKLNRIGAAMPTSHSIGKSFCTSSRYTS